MTLLDVVDGLEKMNIESALCLRAPWQGSAECVVVPNEKTGIPHEIEKAGFSYFLEVAVAKEVLGVLGSRPATRDEKVRLLLYYAENDAYPTWVYEHC